MAILNTEIAFVGSVWREAIANTARATKAFEVVAVDALEHDQVRKAYHWLAVEFNAGRSIDAEEDAVLKAFFALVDMNVAQAVLDYLSLAPKDPAFYAKDILLDQRARRGAQAVADEAAAVAELARPALSGMAERPDPQRVIERVAEAIVKVDRLIAVHVGIDRARTRQQITQTMMAAPDRRGRRGIAWPYEKFGRASGTSIYPGGVYGFTGRSGCGKSLLGSNLWRLLVRAGVPVLPALTEMPQQWLARGYAADARVEQKIAELEEWDTEAEGALTELRRMWRGCDEVSALQRMAERKDRWRVSVEAISRGSWEVLGRGRISLAELLTGWRMLRRLFPGRHCIGILDHAHNLREPEIHARIGEVVAEIKEFCEADDDGFSALVMFQPRKAERGDTTAKFRPVPAVEISGTVEQYLDTHCSIFRQWVEIDQNGYPDEWGNRPVALNERGFPKVLGLKQQKNWKPPLARVDRHHVYTFWDKTRIARADDDDTPHGMCVLDSEGPFGTITEFIPQPLLRAI